MTAVTLPPGPSAPRFVQGGYALTAAFRGVRRMRELYGDAFTVNVPGFGHAVVISGAPEIRQLFMAPTDVADILDNNIGWVMGPGSLFGLTGTEHRKQRRLLTPPFHGRRLAVYEKVAEQETERELASWPQGRPVPTLPSMLRITLNIILRTVFGAEGDELARLRTLVPPMVKLGAWFAMAPIPTIDLGRWSPWGRFRAMRRGFDAVIERLITRAESDPDLDSRDDVLSMMLRCRYDDGSSMSHSEIADELFTMIAAGHETTATTLAWAIERVRRHPDVLDGLAAEADAGGSALREATIAEVQRTRPVIDLVGRQVKAETMSLGPWTIPRGYAVMVSIPLIHDDESLFPNARAFEPARFLDAKPDLYQWIPFGGGTRRCIGAAFSAMEMHVVLRTLLRDFTLVPTDEPDERWHSRGVAYAPGQGGLAVVARRRGSRAAPTGPSAVAVASAGASAGAGAGAVASAGADMTEGPELLESIDNNARRDGRE